jgi:hypothetical protein
LKNVNTKSASASFKLINENSLNISIFQISHNFESVSFSINCIKLPGANQSNFHLATNNLLSQSTQLNPLDHLSLLFETKLSGFNSL